MSSPGYTFTNAFIMVGELGCTVAPVILAYKSFRCESTITFPACDWVYAVIKSVSGVFAFAGCGCPFWSSLFLFPDAVGAALAAGLGAALVLGAIF